MGPLDFLSPIAAIASIFTMGKQEKLLKKQTQLTNQQIQLQREAEQAKIAAEQRRNKLIAYGAAGIGIVVVAALILRSGDDR